MPTSPPAHLSLYLSVCLSVRLCLYIDIFSHFLLSTVPDQECTMMFGLAALRFGPIGHGRGRPGQQLHHVFEL